MTSTADAPTTTQPTFGEWHAAREAALVAEAAYQRVARQHERTARRNGTSMEPAWEYADRAHGAELAEAIADRDETAAAYQAMEDRRPALAKRIPLGTPGRDHATAAARCAR